MPTKENKDTITFRIPKFSFNFQNPFALLLIVALSFLLGMLTMKVQYLEKGLSATTQAPQPSGAQPQKPVITQALVKSLFKKGNLYFGNANSKNLLVEFADPSCPYCHVAAGHNPELSKQVGPQFVYTTDGGTYVPPVTEMKKLVDEGKAAFVYVYTPGHGNGEMGAKAMYCAQEKGTFWQVHDKLMNNESYALLNNEVKNDKTKSQVLATFLADVSDPTEMQKCLDSGKYDTKLTQDIATARSFGVTGTPGFFVNTTNFGGAYSWTEMKAAIL